MLLAWKSRGGGEGLRVARGVYGDKEGVDGNRFLIYKMSYVEL